MANVIDDVKLYVEQVKLDIQGKKASSALPKEATDKQRYAADQKYLAITILLCSVCSVASLAIHPLVALAFAGVAVWKAKIWYFNKS